MPAFKIKNLMIDVIAAEKIPHLEKLCRWPTKEPLIPCLKFISPCRYFRSPCFFFRSRIPDPCELIRSTVIDCGAISNECATSDLPIECTGSDVIVIDVERLVINPELIREVQAEMNAVFEVAAKRGLEINEAMAPQTRAQADAVEAELLAALEEIKAIKGKLK